jgi:hypothetical protein
MVGLLTAAAGHELKQVAVELQHEVGRGPHIREVDVDGFRDPVKWIVIPFGRRPRWA